MFEEPSESKNNYNWQENDNHFHKFYFINTSNYVSDHINLKILKLFNIESSCVKFNNILVVLCFKKTQHFNFKS